MGNIKGDRPMIRFLKRQGYKDLVGVEIGVDIGVNAYNMLSVLDIKQLFLIEPDYKNICIIYKQLKKFKNIIIIDGYSQHVFDLVPDNLDFVYVDGDHRYNSVLQDIELYYPKVRCGGVFGGHDFNTNELGVCKAVIGFVEENDLELFGGGFDWWVIKNNEAL
jgi:predicted O-methyltransferase YrrM